MRKKFSWGWPLRTIAAIALAWFVAAPAQAADPVRIAENDWTGQLIDINLAKVILEDHMGIDVELIFTTFTAQWPGLAVGDLDVAMELYPSYSFAAHEEWIDEKGMVEVLGDLGVVVHIGWYVPTYVIEGDAERGIEPMAPDLRSYKDLNKYVELFQRPETGDKGFFLDGPVGWETNNEARIANLGLNYETVYAGTEGALVAELESAYAKGEPLLFWGWTPHWMQAAYDLTEIEFPPYSDECFGIGQDEPGTFTCGPAEDMTYNVVRVGFKDENPRAYAFLKNVWITTEMQQEMLVLVDSEGHGVEQAVRMWMAQNEDVWKAWIPATAN